MSGEGVEEDPRFSAVSDSAIPCHRSHLLRQPLQQRHPSTRARDLLELLIAREARRDSGFGQARVALRDQESDAVETCAISILRQRYSQRRLEEPRHTLPTDRKSARDLIDTNTGILGDHRDAGHDETMHGQPLAWDVFR